MPGAPEPHPKIAALLEARKARRPLVALTAYSYPWARLLDGCGIDILLVGDSLGMAEHGREDTTTVTLEEMLHHTRSVRAGVRHALLVADLPFGTCETPAQAAESARLLAGAGADAVKIEGGAEKLAEVRSILDAGIPVMGHLGMLPQKIREEGKYRIKGKKPEEAERLLGDAVALENAGAFAVVLELVTPPVAEKITEALEVPTIGIGSGEACAGQILVTYDLLGLTPWFKPAFVKPMLALGETIQETVRAYREEIVSRKRGA